MKPSVGRIVHYVSYGTPGGEYSSVCRAAIVTEVPEKLAVGEDQMSFIDNVGPHVEVSLCVLNPTGMFFNSDIPQSEEDHRGGTWHWPERVE